MILSSKSAISRVPANQAGLERAQPVAWNLERHRPLSMCTALFLVPLR
jgi:hypothetical protein